MPGYLVRARVPDVCAADIRAAASRAAAAAETLHREGFRIHYLDTTYVPGECWFGCLYDADSASVAQLATERAALPFDDIVEAVRYPQENPDADRRADSQGFTRGTEMSRPPTFAVCNVHETREER